VTHKNLDFHVPTLTRVEGEGAMHVHVVDGNVDDVRLEIYEPPRFFEAFLCGRGYREPVDITARICGICPVAYQMSAAQAIERIAGVELGGRLRDLRRLLYCGEWIESHVLHIGFLHAPDFLGYASGLEVAADHPELIEKVLELKKVGNDVMELIGGRPIHPVNVRLGGFYRAPEPEEMATLAAPLRWAQDAAVDLVRWTSGFDFPDATIDHELVSLRHPDEYPICEGRIVSDRGLDIDPSEFEEVMVETHVEHSTALHVHRRDGQPYLTGPLARWANNYDRLPTLVADLAADVGCAPVERNPFRSIVVRSLEVLTAVTEARRLVEHYTQPDVPFVDVPPTAGIGWGATEAPRGVLYHRYSTDADGTILAAQIIPPTAQNQPVIEADLRQLVERFVDDHRDADAWKDEDVHRLEHQCETAIRNYDPCISCATHFLRLEMHDRPPHRTTLA
jgi:sulfhydrogenase subunit alpha